MKFEDVSMSVKLTVATVPVLAAAVIWMFATFETASGSEMKWTQHNQAIACKTVYDLEAKIEEYVARLHFDVGLSQQDKDWINVQIKKLQTKIARIDPQGVC